MAKKNKQNTEENKDVATETQNPKEQEITVEEQLKEELSKEKDKFLRLFAEFENYKKRTAKERIDLFKTAGQDVVSAMLPVLDDFDRAITEIKKSIEEETGVVNELLKGVELINNKFTETLKNKGLTLIEVNQGDTFDAELHEAITQISAPSEDMKGKIIDVIEKGYKLGEKIIRYPKVVVGN